MKTILRLALALVAVLLVSCQQPLLVIELPSPTLRVGGGFSHSPRPAPRYYNSQPRPTVMRQPVMLPQQPCGGNIVGCNPASPYSQFNTGYGQGYGGGYQEMYPHNNMWGYIRTVPDKMPMAVWMDQGRPMPNMGPGPQRRRR